MVAMSNIQFPLLTDLVNCFYLRDLPSPFDKLKVDFNTVKKMLGPQAYERAMDMACSGHHVRLGKGTIKILVVLTTKTGGVGGDMANY